MMVPMAPNDRWSLDFVSDQLTCGRRFRILTVVDDCTRECLAPGARGRYFALRHPGSAGAGPADVQNAFIESFNGRPRDELLNETLFTSPAQARVALGCWRAD
jgi:putative transposase